MERNFILYEVLNWAGNSGKIWEKSVLEIVFLTELPFLKLILM